MEQDENSTIILLKIKNGGYVSFEEKGFYPFIVENK